MVTLVVFFMSTLLWQALKVYTDVWLREWTDNDDIADVCTFNILSLFRSLTHTDSFKYSSLFNFIFYRVNTTLKFIACFQDCALFAL